MLIHWKTMFDRHYCIKTENICYISRYFLHFVVSPFQRCLANAISTDYARSRSGQYTSRNGSKSVAPVPSYWKLRSRALTARELLCKYTAFRRLMHVNNVRHCFCYAIIFDPHLFVWWLGMIVAFPGYLNLYFYSVFEWFAGIYTSINSTKVKFIPIIKQKENK